MDFQGHKPQVGVSKPDPLLTKARALLLGKRITAVHLSGDQLRLHLEDGGEFAVNCEGGFLETE